VPSLHCAVAPVGLLFSAELAGRVAAGAGLDAGATVVFGGGEELAVRHVARIRLYHLVQSVVVAVVFVVVFTAPDVFPVVV
jgi:hypothetical protein